MKQNINENEKQAISQCKMIKAWLEDGKVFTTLEAIPLFGCIRAGARICDLRNKGMNIKTTMITLPNGKRVAEYSLIKPFSN